MFGWKNELRDTSSELPGAYAVDKAGLVFQAEAGMTTTARKRGPPLALTGNKMATLIKAAQAPTNGSMFGEGRYLLLRD